MIIDVHAFMNHLAYPYLTEPLRDEVVRKVRSKR